MWRFLVQDPDLDIKYKCITNKNAQTLLLNEIRKFDIGKLYGNIIIHY